MYQQVLPQLMQGPQAQLKAELTAKMEEQDVVQKQLRELRARDEVLSAKITALLPQIVAAEEQAVATLIPSLVNAEVVAGAALEEPRQPQHEMASPSRVRRRGPSIEVHKCDECIASASAECAAYTSKPGEVDAPESVVPTGKAQTTVTALEKASAPRAPAAVAPGAPLAPSSENRGAAEERIALALAIDEPRAPAPEMRMLSLEDSFVAAGFIRDGFQWTHTEHQIIVIECQGEDGLPYVMAKGVADEDMEAWLDSLDFHSSMDFGGRLVAWVLDHLFMSSEGADPKPGGKDVEDDDCDDDDDEGSDDADWGHYEPLKHYLDRLPSTAQIQAALTEAKIKVNLDKTRHRELVIYTWGDKNGFTKAGISQKVGKPKLHINAKPLNGHGGSCRMNAVQDSRIVKRVCASMQRDNGKWLVDRVKQIEKVGAGCFSVFCSKGRHRSVSAAIILRELLYPNAKLVHLKMA